MKKEQVHNATIDAEIITKIISFPSYSWQILRLNHTPVHNKLPIQNPLIPILGLLVFFSDAAERHAGHGAP